ncbi:chymotrypsin inhibitor-like [Uloborus diversus]|uniref:chymotrypsin inhibitor-like n=1 Tax=Uloborus diversus TaxID=327109 RepID=UPI00240A3D64|nr:chymotrypsin inhibitor-like [Uloborus diversus]
MKTYILILAVCIAVCAAIPANLDEECNDELGEEFTTCGSACPDTCDNYNEIRPCTLQCVIGCHCPRGTVRRESDQHCVKIEEC